MCCRSCEEESKMRYKIAKIKCTQATLQVLIWGAAVSCWAADRPDCPAPITFALYENGYIYDAASNTGIDKDVAEELGRRSGCRFEFSVKPRARIWVEIESGALMMTGSGIQTDKRDVFSWAVRYMAQKNYVLVKNELNANSADQFAADPNLLWGAVRSYKHGEQADAFLDGVVARAITTSHHALRRQHCFGEHKLPQVEPTACTDHKHIHRVAQVKRLDRATAHALPQGYKLAHFGGRGFGHAVLHAQAVELQGAGGVVCAFKLGLQVRNAVAAGRIGKGLRGQQVGVAAWGLV